MAPTKHKTKHKPEKTKVGEEVLDLVLSYIHNVEDRNSVTLVSRKFYEIDGIMRKSLTVHTHYYPNPSGLSKRFPFIKSLTLQGPHPDIRSGNLAIRCRYPAIKCRYDADILPLWIEQLALEFRCLEELHIRHQVVHDEDLETLARTRGKDLRSLKISRCEGFSTNGLRHISKYCNKLRTLCLRSYYDNMKAGIWLHQLALNSTVLERLHVAYTDISYAKDLILLAKNCCNSLISLKIGACKLSKLGDTFRYAVRLEHFSGYNCDHESDLVGFELPQHMCSISIENLPVTRHSIVFPFLNQIRRLKLVYLEMDKNCQCLLFKRCPNLEVLYTKDVCGDTGLQVIAQFCKKLRKLTHNGLVTHVGLIPLVKGCTNLECLQVRLGDISNEAIEFVGTHLKNLRQFRMTLVNENGTTTDLTLDNGIQAMLMGCNKLERMDIDLWHGRLTDAGLDYIGKYGTNLKSLTLALGGYSEAGLVKLSKGCPRLKKLKLWNNPFREKVIDNCVFNIPSLRYVLGFSSENLLTLIRPEFRL